MAKPERGTRPSMRVLLISDNRDFLEAATSILKMFYGVEIVGSGLTRLEAVEQAQILDPQAVFIDLDMRGRGGFATMQQVKRRLPEVAIVALSLIDSCGYRQAAIDAGAELFLSKTRLKGDLFPTIRKLAFLLTAKEEWRNSQVAQVGRPGWRDERNSLGLGGQGGSARRRMMGKKDEGGCFSKECMIKGVIQGHMPRANPHPSLSSLNRSPPYRPPCSGGEGSPPSPSRVVE